jgi:DNA-binding MarR family transcriptional regulator
VTEAAAEENDDWELRSQVGHLIRVSQQVHYALWQASIGVERLTSPQFAVLHVLAHQQPLDQREIGERASLDRSTVADTIARLVDRGLLSRTRDTIDARRNLVSLSKAGRAAHRIAVVGAYNINEKLLLSIADQDRVALVRILNRVIESHREMDSAGLVSIHTVFVH